MWYKIYLKVNKMENNKVVSINKNKEPEIDALESIANTIESFPIIERDILKLFFGLEESVSHTSEEIAEKLNKPKKTIDEYHASGIKRLSDIYQEEKLRQENEDAYSEIRLQMHNHLIKKLRSLKEEWKLDNISQVTERIILAFFKNDLN